MIAREATTAAAIVAALLLGAGCLGTIGQPGGKAARPPQGSDAEIVFDQMAAIRKAQGTTPPTWVDRLTPLAHDGAARLAAGAEGRVMAVELSRKAAYNIGRNVEVWWMSADSLFGLDFPSALVGRRNLMLAVGVRLMTAAGTGRYAIVFVTPEPGHGL